MSKACVRCGSTKPFSDFHKRSKAHDGLNAACKECICAARRQYSAEHPDRAREQRRRYRTENYDAEMARLRAWREANAEHRAEYRRAYDAANAAERAAAKRTWYEAHREWVLSWPERNPERSAARHERFREANRDRRAEAQRKRRVDALGLRVEDVDLEALWTGSCGLCGQLMDAALRWPHPQSKSIDHILPLAAGGTHEASNLQWAHLRCNVSKGAKVLEGVAGHRHS